MNLYSEMAEHISLDIENGVLRPGERLPSVRQMHATRRVSRSTVLQAYRLLEDSGLVSTRPRSGYYVNAQRRSSLAQPALPQTSGKTTSVEVADLIFEVLEGIKKHTLLPLGSAFLSPHLFPLAKLAKVLGTTARKLDPWRIVEDLPPGNPELRRHIARRYLESGANVPLNEIVLTSGASEALQLCLMAVTKPGDVVAVESPAFYGALRALEMANLRAIEIPVHCNEGMDLSALARAVETHDVKACWAMPNFSNPTGALMPVEKKRDLVELLERRGIPLIEDDAYAELFFDEQRPPPAKAFDRAGLVLHCGSFSKCLAPGYRVGWAAPGRFAESVRRRKFLFSIGTNVFAQNALAEFVRFGGYEHHLRQLRKALKSQCDSMLRAVTRYFPPGTLVSRPRGGYFVWVEFHGDVDALSVCRTCMEQNVSIAPGPMFGTRQGFRRHLRLNFGHRWSPSFDRAVEVVANVVATHPTGRGST